MPRLAIARTFLTSYANLEKKVRRSVDEAISKFEHHTHAGLHLEKLEQARDSRIRTIRIDKSWRGVVLAPETGDVYCLLTVLPHDDAIKYAVSRTFSVNQKLGVLEVRDARALEQLAPALGAAAEGEATRLFAGSTTATSSAWGSTPTCCPSSGCSPARITSRPWRPCCPSRSISPSWRWPTA